MDDRGDVTSPALVFVHGGPGQGVFDFMHVQGDRLARAMRVIGIDQRGVLRSDPLPTDTAVSSAEIRDDLELVRLSLGIERWCVVSHSAGGAWALDYVLQHPQVVSCTVFDCPCWDAARTDVARLPLLAKLFDQRGEAVLAQRCRDLLLRPSRLTAADDVAELHARLDDAPELMFAPTTPADTVEHLVMEPGLGDDVWARGKSHMSLLPELYVDRLPRLRGLRCPALLLHGAFDTVTTPDMVDAFKTHVAHGMRYRFERSGHLPYLEQPDEYAKVVIDFALASRHGAPRSRRAEKPERAST